MKKSNLKSLDELPMFLNAEDISEALGIAISTTYELMKQKGFPSLKIGRRYVVERENFIEWVQKNSGGSS